MEIGNLGLSAIPLASFWAAFNSLIKAADFVNGIRDVVITGSKNQVTLTPRLRKAMLFDWFLSMFGTIFTCVAFSAIIAWMGFYIDDKTGETAVAQIMWLVAAFPGAGGLLFVLCGISDFRAMTHAINCTLNPGGVD